MKVALGALILSTLHGWLPLIKAEAKAHHVDAMTLTAIVWHESRGNPSAFFQERDGACSIGLGGIRVAGCEPMRASEMHDPVFNVRTAAAILQANERWCRRHRSDRQCRAGERVFRGGGAVNHYGGFGVAYAGQIKKLRREMRPYWARASRERCSNAAPHDRSQRNRWTCSALR